MTHADWLRARAGPSWAGKGCDLLVVNRVGDGLGFESGRQCGGDPVRRTGWVLTRGSVRSQGGVGGFGSGTLC